MCAILAAIRAQLRILNALTFLKYAVKYVQLFIFQR